MAEQAIAIPEEEEEEEEERDGNNTNNNDNDNTIEFSGCVASRKERRKAAKKEKRKHKRKEMAELVRREEESRLNDPEEQLKIQAEEEREKERVERERREFEERERMLLEAWERKRAQEAEEEAERRKAREEEEKWKQSQVSHDDNVSEDGWEYVEEGPPEIIWQGNEIIVKKKKVRVKKVDTNQQIMKEDPDRPTSNPLPPQSEAFADYKNAPILSAQQLLENVAQQTPNFGTEQDKAHCPFHLKTGVCRFGSCCSRIHFYPDKSCTLLIKNMYNGPGLSWEQDEGLEYTDEEVEHAYEEFYEDVHTEFLKFGEIINFKVCRNGSFHLRGNMYVHYKSLDSAELAYHSVNGRYFAGKQVHCEYVGITRWKVAICGEFMKLKLKTCSRGTSCNFIHCFRNPGGDYEWADWDKPPPKYWVKKMTALFGYSDESGYDKQHEKESPRRLRSSSRMSTYDLDRYHYQRSQSREIDYSRRSSIKYSEYDVGRSTPWLWYGSADRKRPEVFEEKQFKDRSGSRKILHGKSTSSDDDSDRDMLDRHRDRDRHCVHSSKSSRHTHNKKLEYRGGQSDRNSMRETSADANLSGSDSDNDNHHGHMGKNRRRRKKRSEILDTDHVTDSREHKEVSVSPDDQWDERIRTYYSELNGTVGDTDDDSGESANAVVESEDAKSRLHKAHKLNHPSRGDYASRDDGEAKYDNRKSVCYGRNYRYSDSDSDSSYNSSKDFGTLKKSKRKHDTDENFVSESRAQSYKENKSHAKLYQIGEDIDERGRWEPDDVLSGKHSTFRRKPDGNDHKKHGKEPKLSDNDSDKNGNETRSRHGSRSRKRRDSSRSEARNFRKSLKVSQEKGTKDQKNENNHAREIYS